MFKSLFSRPQNPERRYLFILTYGRSGSTLLMGLLNTISHYCIRGENNNVLYRIYEACRALEQARANALKNAERPTHPWYGLDLADPDRFREDAIGAFVNHVLCPQPQHTVIGFKEIRNSEAEVPDFDGYVAFLRTRFAGARLIFNHRPLADVAASKWWSNMPRALEKLQIMEDRFNGVEPGPDVFHFRYERIDESLAHINELFAFLGEPVDAAAVRTVLATRHSY